MASSIPVAQPVAADDKENIPVAQAFVPGAPTYQYNQATPVTAQPYGTAQPYSNPQPVYEATPVSGYPQYEAGKVPPTPYNNYDAGSKPVAAGTLTAGAPSKICGLPKKIFFLILGLVLLLVIGGGIGAAVAASGGGSKKESGTNTPGQSPGGSSSGVNNAPTATGSIDPSIPVGGTSPPSTISSPPSTTPSPPIRTSSPPISTSSPPLQTSSPPVLASPPVTGVTPSPPGSAPTPTLFQNSGTLTSDGQDLVTAINAIRRRNGLRMLTVDSTLTCVAQQLSKTKGGLSNPTCDSTGYPLQTRATQCRVPYDSVSQLTGCEYYLADNQVNSWATDSDLGDVLLNPTWQYVGGDGYPNEKFWTAIFA